MQLPLLLLFRRGKQVVGMKWAHYQTATAPDRMAICSTESFGLLLDSMIMEMAL